MNDPPAGRGRSGRRWALDVAVAGFVTSAADGGASEAKIMAQTGHRSSDQVRTYMRDGRLFHNNAAEATGL